MKYWKISLPAALLISAFWFACRDLEFEEFQKEADVAFAGRVIDEDGQPIEGAQIRAGSVLVLTDANGVFRTPGIRLPADDAKITVTKIGYFDFSRAYIVQDDALQTVTIQLLRKELVGVFNGAAGGTVQVPGGVSLVFPAGAVNHNGSVRVFARYLDPASPDLPLHMPGDLRGINTGGEEGVLATFGMLGVEIADQSGQPLQIASGSEVEIRMPVPAGKMAVAPDNVPLWYYDQVKARWIEEGLAQKIGNQYVGKVKHFSFWNCDAFSATVYMEGKVFLDDDQHPLANATVRLTVLSNGFTGYGYTNANGWFGGAVPKDEAMKLEVLLNDLCGNQVLYTQDIGPFASNTTLPAIVISTPQQQTVNLNGRLLDCNGQAVDNGYVKIEVAGTVFAIFSEADGTFDLNFLNCTNAGAGTAIAYDLTALLESPAQNFSITSNTVSLGDITACNALSEFIEYTLDGQSRTFIEPSGFLEANNTYLYAYDTTSGAVNSINFSFTNSGQTGTFPLNFLNIWPSGDSIFVLNVTTNVTGFSNVGQPIIGTFNGNYSDVSSGNHTISGSYRVIRDQ